MASNVWIGNIFGGLQPPVSLPRVAPALVHAGKKAARQRTPGTNTYPTVWKEMKRQHDLIPALKALFAEAPEALRW